MAAQRYSADNQGLVRLRRVSFVGQTDRREEPQSRYAGLHRLTTFGFDSNRRRPSESGYSGSVEQSPFSVLSFASPTFDGFDHYHDETRTETLKNKTPFQMLSASAMQNSPRRHSTTLTPGGLTSQFQSIAVSSSSAPIQSPRGIVHRKSIIDDSRAMLLAGVGGSELERLGNCVLRGRSTSSAKYAARDPSRMRRKHSQDVLREWGRTYLGNTVTADVLVRSFHLRGQDRGSVGNILGAEQTSPKVDKSRDDWEQVVVRARVTPLAKERQPFLIQRRFNLRELRATSSPQGSLKIEQAGPKEGGSEAECLYARGRSKSSPSGARSQAFDRGSPRSQKLLLNPAVPGSRRMMPIHVEYALRYLPVLGALLLSGHVRRGDIIDLPMPHPEAWRDVVCYIYTGRGEMTHSMKANIVYLAGRVG